MPSTRRKSGNASARNAQSTLSFGAKSRVTKPTLEKVAKTNKSEKASSEPVVDEIVTTDVPIREHKKEQLESPESKEDVLAHNISEAQVDRYWKAEEKKRKAPRG